MAERLDWRTSEDRRDHVHRAVETLVKGSLVVFPSESVYVLAALATDPAAVERLVQWKERPTAKPLTVAAASAGHCFKLVPRVSAIGRRLASRCWPGPVTMVFPVAGASPLDRLPASVRDSVLSDKGLGLRVSEHPALLETLRLLPAPLVVASANRSGRPEPVDSESIDDAWSNAALLLLDDGPTRYQKPSTVAWIGPNRIEILREGVVTKHRLERLSNEVITFVCTGNSCRSPMAEAIFKKMLAERLGCDIDDLPDHGYTILSAGLSAPMGEPASEGARLAVRDHGATLEEHSSQPLTQDLARLSDRLIVMTNEHRRTLVDAWPALAEKTALLCADADVVDPIGQSLERYRTCARQVAENLNGLLPKVLERRAG